MLPPTVQAKEKKVPPCHDAEQGNDPKKQLFPFFTIDNPTPTLCTNALHFFSTPADTIAYSRIYNRAEINNY